MGGSANVVIRGYSSLSGTNQALFVVDGTPIDNETGNSLNAETGRGGVDFGNAAMDINPSSIASVSILKGLSLILVLKLLGFTNEVRTELQRHLTITLIFHKSYTLLTSEAS